MLYRRANIAVLFCLFALIPLQSSFGQNTKVPTSVLCRSDTTELVVTRTKCRSGETRVNPGSFSFGACSWKLGTPVSLAGQTGQITISETCPSNQVLVNHAVSHNELNSGIVSVSSIAFTQPVGASHSLPQGVRVRLNLVSTSGIQPPIPSAENVSAEVNLLCCPFE